MRRSVRRSVNLSTGCVFITWGHIIFQTIQDASINWSGLAVWLAASAAIATGPLVSKAMQKRHEPPFDNNGQ